MAKKDKKQNKNTLESKKLDPRVYLIANKIRMLREENGFVSSEFFAWKNKIPRVQYWRMERGTNFTIESLLRVLDAHNISLQQFFNEIDERKDVEK